MKNKKENIRLRTTDTVGKQGGHMDHDDRGAVSGHMDCYVLFFPRVTAFSCPHCSLKNSALNIMWNCFGKRILESGFLIP